jgi:hypothetical protein
MVDATDDGENRQAPVTFEVTDTCIALWVPANPYGCWRRTSGK